MPNINPFASSEVFTDAVVSELRARSVETLSTHLRDLLLRSVSAVQKVFVSKDDNPADMKAVVSGLLLSVGTGIADGQIPFEFQKDNEGKLTGEFKFEITPEVAEMLLPDLFLERSGRNKAIQTLKRILG